MAETTVTLTGHDSKVVGQGRTVHEFDASDGNRYSTFKGEVAEKALALVGQAATLEYTVQQKGEYTNFYLQDAKPANGAVPITTTTTQVSPGSGSVDALSAAFLSEPKQLSIRRQVAMKAAIDLVGNEKIDLGQLYSMADQILDWIEGRSAL